MLDRRKAPRRPSPRAPFDAPLSDARAAALVDELAVAPGGHIVDLGCGWAELLLRMVESHPGTTGTGIDIDQGAINRGVREASLRGLYERVELVEGDAAVFEDRADVVLCVGAAEGLGRASRALHLIAEILEPGGLALFGDRIWNAPAGAVARAGLGDLPVLDGLLALARAAGFSVTGYDVSTPAEWESYATAWHEALAEAAVPDPLFAAEVEAHASSHGGAVGFVWLELSKQPT
ncbi:MAG: methyltransferase domain-containing protein [Gaiellales bacterium]